jgi:hypothetical protein
VRFEPDGRRFLLEGCPDLYGNFPLLVSPPGWWRGHVIPEDGWWDDPDEGTGSRIASPTLHP